jgi:hypothetical protein
MPLCSAVLMRVGVLRKNYSHTKQGTVNSRKKCMFLYQNTPKAISEYPFGHLDG